MSVTRAAFLFLVLASTAGCGDDDAPPLMGRAGTGGTGGMDASVDASLDANMDAALDALVDDGGDQDGGDVPRCQATEEDRFVADTLSVDPTTFSLYGAPAGFGLAYEVSTCGNGISVVRFESGNASFSPQTPVNGSGDCTRAYDPLLTLRENVWRLYYWDNREGQNDLWSLPIDSGAAPTREATGVEGGRAPQLATIGGVDYLGWGNQTADSWRGFYVREASAHDTPGRALVSPAQHGQGFGFVLAGVEAVGVLAWVDAGGADKGAFLLPLDGSANLLSEPIKLATQVTNRASVDVADGINNAAVLYSTSTNDQSFELRFRPLDEMGRPTGIEERIVTRNERGTDGSLAPLGGGYVVAFRALPEIEDGTATIKVFIIDKVGRRLNEPVALATTTRDGGRLTVRSAYDGRFTIAWTEADATGQRVRLIHVPCR